MFNPMFDLMQSDSIRHAESYNPFYCARSEALEVEILTMAGQMNAAQYRFLTLLFEIDEHGGWHQDETDMYIITSRQRHNS